MRGAAPRPRPNAHAGGECADDGRGGRVGNRGPPPRGGAGGPRRDPHPPAPRRPGGCGGAGPRPLEAEGMIPPPPGETAAPVRGAGARPAPPPQPPAPTGTAGSKRTRANAPGRRTDCAQRRQASTNRSGMGATPSMTRTTPVTPALLPAQGTQRDGTRQSDPPPNWHPRPHKRGARRTPPPPHPTPRHRNSRMRRPTLGGAHNPEPGRGEPGRPSPSTPDGARDRGRTRGGARTAWNGPTSAQRRDRGRCARHTTQGGGGERTPRECKRTHTQRAREDYQKGSRTELAERTDRVEWRTSERG